MQKLMIWLGMLIGSIIGGYLPTLWGASFLSAWSLVLSSLGAIIGIIIGYKMTADEY